MRALVIIADATFRAGWRNRWVLSATLLLAVMAAALAGLGSAPVGTVGADRLAITVVSLSSLSVFLVPLIALLLTHDAIVGEIERGTMLLLLAYPVRRWQVIVGKYVGHLAILVVAVIAGYGVAGLIAGWQAGAETWLALGRLIASAVLLGAGFAAIGYGLSAFAGNRGLAAGLAVAAWLLLVVLWDLGLLAVLVADAEQRLSATLVQALMLANPADAFRMLNLGPVGDLPLAGLTGLAARDLPPAAWSVAALAAWCLVPLGIAAWRFARREL